MASLGDLAEVEVLFDLAASGSFYAECTFGFKVINVAATRTGLASSFRTALVKATSGGILYPVVSALQVSLLRVSDVYPGVAATFYTTAGAIAGNASGDPLPPQNAYLLSWSTDLKGRSFRGRTYLPGVSEAVQANGTISGAQVTALQTVVTQMLAVFGVGGTDGNWQFVIISRVLNNNPRVPPIGTAVTSGLAEGRVQTQRRRNRG